MQHSLLLSSQKIAELKLEDGDEIYVNFKTGEIRNITKEISMKCASIFRCSDGDLPE